MTRKIPGARRTSKSLFSLVTCAPEKASDEFEYRIQLSVKQKGVVNHDHIYRTIKTNEQSANVPTLHAVLDLLGLHVDPQEVNEQRAGDSTERAVRQIQSQFGLTPTPGYMVDDATATAINKLQARGTSQ